MKVYSKTEDLSKKGDASSAMHNGKFNINGTKGEEEESEVAISTEEFKEKIKNIYKSFADCLNKQKTSIRELFQNDIYVHKIKESNDEYEAINLQKVCELLSSLDILNDTVDIYCLFSDLKYSEDYETIDVVKFEKRIERYLVSISHRSGQKDQSIFKSELGDDDNPSEKTINSNDLKNSYSKIN